MNKISGILMLLIYVCVTVAILSVPFSGRINVENLVRYSALFAIIGIGVSFVIITGGIDLSIGSLIGLVGCILPMLLMDRGWSAAASLAVVICVALVGGLVHGLLITKIPLQPFVVTLCFLMIYRGLARWLTGDDTQGFETRFDDSLRLLATGKPCTVALVMAVVGVLTVLWSAWRLWLAWRRSSSQREVLLWARPIAGLVIGTLLLVVGGSRYASGFEFEFSDTQMQLAGISWSAWSVHVPDVAAARPQKLMQWCGWLALPALVAFQVLAMRRDWKRMLLPTIAIVLSAIAIRWATRWDEPPTDAWRRLGVAIIVAVLMASFAWYARRGRQLIGDTADLPMRLATACGILWLAGQTQLAVTRVPAPVFTLTVIAACSALFLNQTVFGRYLFALGRNEEAARYSGIRTDRMVILAYVICSAITGIGGILFALESNSVAPASHGNFYELYAIAAAVLGGCSLRGGEGTVLGVIIGATVIRVLYNSINLLQIDPRLEFTIMGAVILLGVIADELVRRWMQRRAASH